MANGKLPRVYVANSYLSSKLEMCMCSCLSYFIKTIKKAKLKRCYMNNTTFHQCYAPPETFVSKRFKEFLNGNSTSSHVACHGLIIHRKYFVIFCCNANRINRSRRGQAKLACYFMRFRFISICYSALAEARSCNFNFRFMTSRGSVPLFANS